MEKKKNIFQSLADYVKDAYKELTHHVVWPSWKEVQRLTVVVAMFSFLFSLFIFVVDWVFRKTLTYYYKIIR